jgi:transposase-like protein
MEVNIQNLIDDARCYEVVRDLRWPEKTQCPHCESDNIIRRGKDDTEPYKQRYECKSCFKRFDDLTNTVFSGHHRPLKTWILFLYFLGLNLSTEQIAKELCLNKDDAHYMATILRSGIVDKKPESKLSGEVECDEVYVVAGHKGNPAAVKKRGVLAAGTDFEAPEGEVHWKRKNPLFLA